MRTFALWIWDGIAGTARLAGNVNGAVEGVVRYSMGSPDCIADGRDVSDAIERHIRLGAYAYNADVLAAEYRNADTL